MDFYILMNYKTKEGRFIRHPDFDGDWPKRYFPKSKDMDYIDAERVYEEPVYGLYYSWELAGPDGADFYLYVPEGTLNRDVIDAKLWLRRHHDVVKLTVVKLTNNPEMEE